MEILNQQPVNGHWSATDTDIETSDLKDCGPQRLWMLVIPYQWDISVTLLFARMRISSVLYHSEHRVWRPCLWLYRLATAQLLILTAYIHRYFFIKLIELDPLTGHQRMRTFDEIGKLVAQWSQTFDYSEARWASVHETNITRLAISKLQIPSDYKLYTHRCLHRSITAYHNLHDASCIIANEIWRRKAERKSWEDSSREGLDRKAREKLEWVLWNDSNGISGIGEVTKETLGNTEGIQTESFLSISCIDSTLLETKELIASKWSS